MASATFAVQGAGVRYRPLGALIQMPDNLRKLLEEAVSDAERQLDAARSALNAYIAKSEGSLQRPDRPSIRSGEYHGWTFPRAVADYLQRKSSGRATLQELIEEVVERGAVDIKNPRTSLKMLSNQKQGGNPNPIFIWQGERDSEDLNSVTIKLANPAISLTDIGGARQAKPPQPAKHNQKR